MAIQKVIVLNVPAEQMLREIRRPEPGAYLAHGFDLVRRALGADIDPNEKVYPGLPKRQPVIRPDGSGSYSYRIALDGKMDVHDAQVMAQSAKLFTDVARQVDSELVRRIRLVMVDETSKKLWQGAGIESDTYYIESASRGLYLDTNGKRCMELDVEPIQGENRFVKAVRVVEAAGAAIHQRWHKELDRVIKL